MSFIFTNSYHSIDTKTWAVIECIIIVKWQSCMHFPSKSVFYFSQIFLNYCILKGSITCCSSHQFHAAVISSTLLKTYEPIHGFSAVRFFSRQCDILIVYDAEILEISVNFWVMRPGCMIKIACANCPCVHLLLISGRTWHTPAELCSSPFE